MQCSVVLSLVEALKMHTNCRRDIWREKSNSFLSLEIWRKCLIGSPELCVDD